VRVVWRFGVGAVVAGALGACAAVTGLDQYTPGACVEGCDASVEHWSLSADDAGVPDSADDAASAPDGLDGIDSADPADVETEGAGGESATDGQPGRGDAGKLDAGAGSHDAGSSPDGADAGPPACGPETCNSGCCDGKGNCALTSASTCGTGGVACKDCQQGGQICSSGSCAMPVVDSGAACSPSTCLNLCAPYFHQCCNASQVCGCSLNYPVGPCL
jgi:hypothetical protein